MKIKEFPWKSGKEGVKMQVHKIVECIKKISGSYNPYVVFSDWVKMYAISIQNACAYDHGEVWKQREKMYQETAGKYNQNELKDFCWMSGLLAECFEENGINDYLGEIYMSSGAGSKITGQFFTPFHISMLNAATSLSDVTREQKICLNEPSAGGGGMILAAAKILFDKGINYQKCLDVTAQDLDWNGVYMTYVQLSILGIKAEVIQGNALSEDSIRRNIPEEKILVTPAKIGAII